MNEIHTRLKLFREKIIRNKLELESTKSGFESLKEAIFRRKVDKKKIKD